MLAYTLNNMGAIMRELLYILQIRIIRFVLKLIPWKKVHNDQIVFISYLGKQYSCNPKYISEYIHSQNNSYTIVWAFNDPEKFHFLNNKGIQIVKYNSLQFIKLCLTSKYIVTNTRDLTHIPFSKRQCVINTWHGGGAYKRVGSEKAQLAKVELFREKIAQKTPLVYLSSCRLSTEYIFRKSFHHSGLVLNCGMPRNDILINGSPFDLKKRVYNKLNIPINNKILLYAPTFRDNRIASDYSFDLASITNTLEEKFGGKWTVLLRLHYYIAEQLLKTDNNFINASLYPDMQELLYVSDVLITDYSSSIWDFSFTNRPCFLYATDLSSYDLTQGFYTNIYEWPFPLAQNNQELIQNIRNFNHTKYNHLIENHHQKFGSYEVGTACQQVYNFIISNSK